MTFSLAPGETPLGIQQPFLPSIPLGQPLVQPRFLTPLGARSLTVLDPSIVRSSNRSPALDWQSPFQDSPFFDSPEPRSPEPDSPIDQPTLQRQALATSEGFSNRSPATLSENSTESRPASNLDATEPLIAQPFATTSVTPAPVVPAVEPQPASVDAFVSLSPLEAASVEQFAEDAPDFLPDVAAASRPETLLSYSVAADTQPFPSPDAAQPDSSPKSRREATPTETVVSPTPTVQRAVQQKHGDNPTVELSTPSPPTSPTQAEDLVAENLVSLAPLSADPSASAVEPPGREPVSLEAAAIAQPSPTASQSQDAPFSLPADASTTAIVAPANVSVSPSVAESSTTAPLVIEPSAPTIAQSVAEEATVKADAQPAIEPLVPVIQLHPGATSAEPTVAKTQSSLYPELSASVMAQSVTEESAAESYSQGVPDATTPDATASAIAPSGLEALTTEPTRSEAVIQPSPAKPSTTTPNASVSLPEAFLPGSLTAHFSQPESEVNRSPSDASFKAVPADTERSSIEPFLAPDMPEVVTPTVIQAKGEQGNESMVERSTDRLEEVSESFQTKTAGDVTSGDIFETVQRKANRDLTNERLTAFNVDEYIGQEQIKPEAVEPGDETRIDAIVTTPSLATSIDQTAYPVAETPSIETPIVETPLTVPFDAQLDQADSSLSASLPEVEQSQASLFAANSLNSPRSGFEPLTAPALKPERPLQLDTSDGIEAVTQPSIQSKTEAPIRRSPASLPTTLDIPAAEASQVSRAEASQPPTTMPDLNASTLSVQASVTAIEPANFDVATAASSVLDKPGREASPKQFNALPELPTTVQRLSVWEPLVQMQPLSPTVAPAASQPAQPTSYPAIPTSQAQPFDRQTDSSIAPEPSGFDAVLPNNVISRKAEAVPTEWSSIAELFQSVGESRDTASSSADMTVANGYSDLNLHSDSTVLPNTLQRQTNLAAIDQAAKVATSTSSTGEQTSPSSQQQAPNASPEQFERLAQEVYRLVRQRLALERERVGNLYARRSM